mgnify:CR=1 FL=1
MSFRPSASPPTNQKLTKSLTKSVETGTTKNVPPKREARKLNYQLFCSEHVATQRRGAGRGDTFASRDSAKP